MAPFQGSQAILTVHHLGRSQSERIVWLCEELELPYELKRYDREPSGAAPADYKALHPFGTAPVITDGEFVLASPARSSNICVGAAPAGGSRRALMIRISPIISTGSTSPMPRWSQA